MIHLARPIRYATPADAGRIAELANLASAGLALYLWRKAAPPGVDPWVVGRKWAARDLDGSSDRCTVVAAPGGHAVAALAGYPLKEVPDPWPPLPPPVAIPLLELEDMVPGTWYVNVLATLPEHRGQGYATTLLAVAEHLARSARRRGMSIIVADNNIQARRLYERCGYREVASRLMVKDAWQHPGSRYVLLSKRLAM